VGAMIGRNPAAFSIPETNMFVSDTLEGLWSEMADRQQLQIHGLLRTVAELFAGEQTISAIAMARRWLTRRMHWPTNRVFEEIVTRAAPFRIVEKSRIHVRNRDAMDRIRLAAPNASFVHVVRHPRTQGAAMLQAEGEWKEFTRQMVEPGNVRSEPDPQQLWLKVETGIEQFLATIPAERQVRLRAEDLFATPETELARVATALGLPADERAVTAMLHPEDSPFARIGPFGAQLGDEPEFLRDPLFRAGSLEAASLDGPLAWRADRSGFNPEVLERARALGYA
jgi:hypothetical protein